MHDLGGMPHSNISKFGVILGAEKFQKGTVRRGSMKRHQFCGVCRHSWGMPMQAEVAVAVAAGGVGGGDGGRGRWWW